MPLTLLKPVPAIVEIAAPDGALTSIHWVWSPPVVVKGIEVMLSPQFNVIGDVVGAVRLMVGADT